MVGTVTAICRYPVKGLSAERMDRVVLTSGQCLPHDRRFAIALIPADARGRFNEALDLLQRAWEQLATRDDVARYDYTVANLITAGEWREVLSTIASIPPNDAEPQDKLVQVQALIQTGSSDVALTEARALRYEFGDTRLGETAAALSLNAAAQHGCLDEELTEALGRSPRSIVLRSVGVGLLDEADARRQILLAELDDLVIKSKMSETVVTPPRPYLRQSRTCHHLPETPLSKARSQILVSGIMVRSDQTGVNLNSDRAALSRRFYDRRGRAVGPALAKGFVCVLIEGTRKPFSDTARQDGPRPLPVRRQSYNCC